MIVLKSIQLKTKKKRTMKKSFKILAVGALFLSSAFVQVNAQEAPKKAPIQKEHQQLTPEQRVDKFVEKFAKDLNLTDQQKQQIKEIKLKEMAERKAAHEAQKQIRKNFHEEVNKVLTAEQKAKLEQIKKEKAEQFKNSKGGHGKYHHYKQGEKPAPRK